MTTIMKASNQWASRPADERYVSLNAMFDDLQNRRDRSDARVVDVRNIEAFPDEKDPKTILLAAPGHTSAHFSHWAFSQACQLAKTHADWLRTVGAKGGGPLVADNLNFGLRFLREVEEVGLCFERARDPHQHSMLRASTGPRYGRVWDAEVVQAIMQVYGDGRSGKFRVPGEFGKAVQVTKDNTTLYAGDRDMFVFLADEENRIELPNRRNGQAGSLARGFFCWNSEVAKSKLGAATFLFDYVCCNRIVWGAEHYAEIDIRHTSSAPERWLNELKPALVTYANNPTSDIVTAITAAQQAKIESDVAEFMTARFGKQRAAAMASIHILEEQRPIETLWDAATAATAYARSVEHQDARVLIERQAGELLKLAA